MRMHAEKDYSLESFSVAVIGVGGQGVQQSQRLIQLLCERKRWGTNAQDRYEPTMMGGNIESFLRIGLDGKVPRETSLDPTPDVLLVMTPKRLPEIFGLVPPGGREFTGPMLKPGCRVVVNSTLPPEDFLREQREAYVEWKYQEFLREKMDRWPGGDGEFRRELNRMEGGLKREFAPIRDRHSADFDRIITGVKFYTVGIYNLKAETQKAFGVRDIPPTSASLAAVFRVAGLASKQEYEGVLKEALAGLDARLLEANVAMGEAVWEGLKAMEGEVYPEVHPPGPPRGGGRAAVKSRIPQETRILTGNQAAIEGVFGNKVDFSSDYMITPWGSAYAYMCENVTDSPEHIEPSTSEINALAYNVGAAIAGARVVWGTASEGYSYQKELEITAQGMRLPMVMIHPWRAPTRGAWNIHGDAVFVWDRGGGVRLVARTPQQAYDMLTMAIYMAEHELLHNLVYLCYAGDRTSNYAQRVRLLPKEVLRAINPPRRWRGYQAVVEEIGRSTQFWNICERPLEWVRIQRSLYNSVHHGGPTAYREAAEKYLEASGRDYRDPLELDFVDEKSSSLIVTMGSHAEDAMVWASRHPGWGVVSPRMLPFPADRFKQVIEEIGEGRIERVVVIDPGGATLDSAIGPLAEQVALAVPALIGRIHSCILTGALNTTDRIIDEAIRQPASIRRGHFLGLEDDRGEDRYMLMGFERRDLRKELTQPFDLTVSHHCPMCSEKTMERTAAKHVLPEEIRKRTGKDGRFNVVFINAGCATNTQGMDHEMVWKGFPDRKVAAFHTVYPSTVGISAGFSRACEILGKKNEIITLLGDGGLGIGEGQIMEVIAKGYDVLVCVEDNENTANTRGGKTATTPLEAATPLEPQGRQDPPIFYPFKFIDAGLEFFAMVVAEGEFSHTLSDALTLAKQIRGPKMIACYIICQPNHKAAPDWSKEAEWPPGFPEEEIPADFRGRKRPALSTLAVMAGDWFLFSYRRGEGYRTFHDFDVEQARRVMELYVSAQGRYSHLSVKGKEGEALSRAKAGVERKIAWSSEVWTEICRRAASFKIPTAAVARKIEELAAADGILQKLDLAQAAGDGNTAELLAQALRDEEFRRFLESSEGKQAIAAGGLGKLLKLSRR